MLDDGDQRGERAVYPGDHRGEGIETITIVRRRARFPARAGDPSESLGARGDEPRRRDAGPAATTATRAPMDRRAVDVASASPDSTAEAESATCRPSTRASAMRHSRRARETSSGHRDVRRGLVGDGARPGVAMVSPATPRRARASRTPRAPARVGGVRFVDDGDADGSRSRASFQEMYRAGAKSASNRARGDSGASDPSRPRSPAAGAHHTASAQAACAPNHIAPGRAAAPASRPRAAWSANREITRRSPPRRRRRRRPAGRIRASDDARDRAWNGGRRGEPAHRAHRGRPGIVFAQLARVEEGPLFRFECTASDAIDSAADNPSSMDDRHLPAPQLADDHDPHPRCPRELGHDALRRRPPRFCGAVAPPRQPPGGAFASANASATFSSTPSSPAMSPRDSSSCAAAASCARNHAVCAIAWMASDPSGRRRSAETTAAMESTDHIVSAARGANGGGATATNLRRTLAADGRHARGVRRARQREERRQRGRVRRYRGGASRVPGDSLERCARLNRRRHGGVNRLLRRSGRSRGRHHAHQRVDGHGRRGRAEPRLGTTRGPCDVDDALSA